MALGARDAEVAELTRALTARVWVEQAKGALVATEGLDPAPASRSQDRQSDDGRPRMDCSTSKPRLAASSARLMRVLVRWFCIR